MRVAFVKALARDMFKSLGYTVVRRGSRMIGPSTSAAMIDTVDLSVRVYDHQDEASDLLRTAAPYTMTSLERMMALYQVCRHIEQAGIQGDLVECGVWRGGSAGIMAGVNLRRGRAPRTLWLYDSFEGIPQPRAEDGPEAAAFADGMAAGDLVTTNKLVAAESSVLQLLSILGFPREHTRIMKGWFQDTVPAEHPERIAVLRLDGDWYESTKVCLDHLYPRVVEGGVVIVDDYGDWEGCKKAVDEYFQQHGITAMLHHVDRTCRYFIKDRRQP
jgi:hypothetical protein